MKTIFPIAVARPRLATIALAAALLAGCLGSKLTAENFDRVQPGMSQSEVSAILGEPGETSSLAIGGLSGAMSSWSDGKASISVQFVNGKVQAKQFSKEAGTAPAAK